MVLGLACCSGVWPAVKGLTPLSDSTPWGQAKKPDPTPDPRFILSRCPAAFVLLAQTAAVTQFHTAA